MEAEKLRCERARSIVQWLIKNGYATNQKCLAKLLGYNHAALSQILNGKVPMSGKFMNTLCSKNSALNRDWLETGEGEMFTTSDTEVSTKEQITNIPIIKNKIEKSQEIVLSNQQIIDGHISLSAMFPVPKENLAAFIMNDNSMSGAGFLMQDILFIDTRACGLVDDVYLFVQNEKVYCRLFLFEEISNTVRICAMHTSDIRDVSVLEEIKIPEMESKYKIIGKVLAFLRKNSLF